MLWFNWTNLTFIKRIENANTDLILNVTNKGWVTIVTNSTHPMQVLLLSASSKLSEVRNITSYTPPLEASQMTKILQSNFRKRTLKTTISALLSNLMIPNQWNRTSVVSFFILMSACKFKGSFVSNKITTQSQTKVTNFLSNRNNLHSQLWTSKWPSLRIIGIKIMTLEMNAYFRPSSVWKRKSAAFMRITNSR